MKNIRQYTLLRPASPSVSNAITPTFHGTSERHQKLGWSSNHQCWAVQHYLLQDERES